MINVIKGSADVATPVHELIKEVIKSTNENHDHYHYKAAGVPRSVSWIESTKLYSHQQCFHTAAVHYVAALLPVCEPKLGPI